MLTYCSWRRMVGESALFLVGVSFLSIFAGLNIEQNLELISEFPTLLLVVPAFIGVCGGIASTFSARLTSALQLGRYNLNKRKERVLVNAEATIINTVVFFVFLTLLAYGLGVALGLEEFNLLRLVLFLASTVISAIVVITMAMAIAVGVAVYTLKRGLDPDNFESPILSTFSDLIGVITFISISSLIII